MPAVFFCQFKLKKDADTAEFLAVSKRLNDEHISKQKGYVGWQQLFDGEKWLDLCTFESMEDVKAFEANSTTPNEYALAFYEFINMPSCVVRYYEVVAEHE
ncbi:MAG: hypothetical protein FWB93_06550 [Oscillospiraceae bacterium]|nr:hypothetical protein [Oscillospiraceae bacterium]